MNRDRAQALRARFDVVDFVGGGDDAFQRRVSRTRSALAP
jgi:hypothetical protein